jgi:GPH family glycoside/pentoside/hexuronide:cation symporter
MIPDIVEIDEFKTGKRREGLFLGTTSLLFKAGIALSVLIVGQLLNLIGYTPETADSPSVLLGIRIIFGPFLAGMILVSIVTTFFFPITRKRHKALLKAIEAKKAGETWDEEAIKKLL